MAPSEKPKCNRTNVDGSPCKNNAADGLEICGTHARAQATGRKNRKPANPKKKGNGKPKGPGGRPVTIDPKKTATLVDLLKAGNFITTACQVAGIPYETFRDWMDKATRNAANYKVYREFADKIEAALAEGEAVRVTQIAKAGAQDWKAAAWLLERHFPEKWGRPSQRTDGPAAPPAQPESGSTDGVSIRDLVSRAKV